jgi:predicted Zn-dependent protease
MKESKLSIKTETKLENNSFDKDTGIKVRSIVKTNTVTITANELSEEIVLQYLQEREALYEEEILPENRS